MTRNKRRMMFTKASDHLFERTLHAVANLNIAIESISDLSQSAPDKIRLTVSRFVYQLLLQPIYAEFCQMYPEIQLEISISDATIDLILFNCNINTTISHSKCR